MRESIQDIENELNSLREQLAIFKNEQSGIRDLKEVVYQESSVNDFIEDVSQILQQLGFLVRSHKIFQKLSTYGERVSLYKQLVRLRQYLSLCK